MDRQLPEVHFGEITDEPAGATDDLELDDEAAEDRPTAPDVVDVLGFDPDDEPDQQKD